MPIYEYACLKCNGHFEVMQKAADKPLKKCGECGGKLEKQWSQTSVQFKGSGWYVTDYAGKKNGEDKSGDASKGEANSSETKSTETKGSETKGNETKETADKPASSNGESSKAEKSSPAKPAANAKG